VLDGRRGAETVVRSRSPKLGKGYSPYPWWQVSGPAGCLSIGIPLHSRYNPPEPDFTNSFFEPLAGRKHSTSDTLVE
jgi:hypothetical protein